MTQQPVERAAALRKNGDFCAAEQALLQVLQEQPGHAGAHYQLACTYDVQGKEAAAAEHYEAALAGGLEEDREGAYLGLGSTYRCLGQYGKSCEVLDRAIVEYPDSRVLHVFRALTLYNLGQPAKSIETLLVQLLQTTDDAGIRTYEKALSFYADKLDQTWG